MNVRASAFPFACVLGLSACLSSNPPGPGVRFFDPLPEIEDAPPRGIAIELVVTGAPQLAQDFALRIGPREVAFDPDVRWTAAPRDLVLAALERALFRGAFTRGGEGARILQVHVARFELDLAGEPAASVELEVMRAGAPTVPIAATAPAASREPRALADAMAKALARAVMDVRELVR